MGEHIIKLPDVGEGVAEAELVEWNVAVGDVVQEDAILASVMTDKAAVEIPSPVAGTVLWLGGDVGESLAVGSPLVRLEVSGEGNVAATPPAASRPEPEVAAAPAEEAPEAGDEPKARAQPKPAPAAVPPRPAPQPATVGAPRRGGEKPLASPAVRQRRSAGSLAQAQVLADSPGDIRAAVADLEKRSIDAALAQAADPHPYGRPDQVVGN